MKKTVFFLSVLVTGLLCLNLHQCNEGRSVSSHGGVVIDTLTYIDTIPYYNPVPCDSVVVRYITEKLPVAKQAEPDSRAMSEVETGNIIASADSIEVVIPITQKEYKGQDYQAWVSGYKTSLDSLLVFPQTHVITIRDKPKRWGVGFSVGYGATPGGFQPYVGVSLSYNLWNF